MVFMFYILCFMRTRVCAADSAPPFQMDQLDQLKSLDECHGIEVCTHTISKKKMVTISRVGEWKCWHWKLLVGKLHLVEFS